jgi:hypothetical protein
MLLKYRNKPKFRFKKVFLRPLKNGRISKADVYIRGKNQYLKAHYGHLETVTIVCFTASNFAT